MGSGRKSWLCSLFYPRTRKSKDAKSKNMKVHSTIEKSDISDNHAINGDSKANISAQHLAAARIQSAYRAYKAKKTIRRVKGALKFNVLIDENDTTNQALSALNHIHSWTYIQAKIQARRYHMVTEGRIKQKRLENQMKLDTKLHELEVEWCGGSETMEEILLRIQQREEAAVKRERTMAYAFSHQWRANATQYLGQAYFNMGKENWGWSWKERWIAVRPWEVRVQIPLPRNQKKCNTKQLSKSEKNGSLHVKPALLSNGNETVKAKKVAELSC